MRGGSVEGGMMTGFEWSESEGKVLLADTLPLLL